MSDLPDKGDLRARGENHRFRTNPRQIGGGVIAVVLVIFIASNSTSVPVSFLMVEVTTPLWLTLTVTALFGAAVGALLLSRRQKRRARG